MIDCASLMVYGTAFACNRQLQTSNHRFDKSGCSPRHVCLILDPLDQRETTTTSKTIPRDCLHFRESTIESEIKRQLISTLSAALNAILPFLRVPPTTVYYFAGSLLGPSFFSILHDPNCTIEQTAAGFLGSRPWVSHPGGAKLTRATAHRLQIDSGQRGWAM